MSHLRALVRRVQQGQTTAYAAALAYSFLFALFPLLLFLTALLGMLHLPSVKNYLEGPASVLIAPVLRQLILSVIANASRFKSPTLLSVGAAGFVWIMSSALRQLGNALNHAYGISQPRRPLLHSIAISVALGLFVGVLMVASVAVGTWGQDIISWIFLLARHHPPGATLAAVLRWVTLLVLVWVLLTLVYNWLPDQRQGFHWTLPGTLAALILWLLISLGFSLYATHFNHYNRTYGSLGAVILLLVYLYIVSFALLLGGEINALLAKDASPP